MRVNPNSLPAVILSYTFTILLQAISTLPANAAELFSAVGDSGGIFNQTNNNQRAYSYVAGPSDDLPRVYDASASTNYGTNFARAFASSALYSAFPDAAAISIWSDHVTAIPLVTPGDDGLLEITPVSANVHIGGTVTRTGGSESGFEIHYLALLSKAPVSVDAFMSMLTGMTPVPTPSIDTSPLLDIWLDQSDFMLGSSSFGMDFNSLQITRAGLVGDVNTVDYTGGYLLGGLFVTARGGDEVDMWNPATLTFSIPNGGGLITGSGATYPAALVPEADSWAMLLAGLTLVGVVARRRRGDLALRVL